MSLRGQKFLLVVNDMAWFWSHRLPLAKDIIAQGAELHLATNGAASNREIAALGIKGHDLPEHTGSFNPLGQLMLVCKILETLKNVKPDIVHAITVRHAFFTGLASRAVRTPRAVFTIAGLGSLLNSKNPKVKAVRSIVVPLFKLAFGGEGRFVIFQNPDDAKALVRSGAIEKQRCTIIRGSGVDPVQFSYTPEPEAAVPTVLFCSRLLKAKGIGEFVHAARILKSKGVNARFAAAGDIAGGNHDSVTAEELAHWKEEGTVEFLGQRSDIAQLMKDAAIVTLPSYYGEGVPKVLLEAAATGRAIVTTDMPGCRETVEDGATGILVEAKDAWSLAAGLEKLLADAALRKSMGEKGRARIETEFTVEKVNAKTMAVYARLFPESKKAGLRQAA
jgi:glycosyltransferase involved in cell wall biosynthesis